MKNKIVILLRKKMLGENSIEEIAYRLKRTLNVDIIFCPEYSTSLLGLIKNIKFARKINTSVVHILTSSEAYLLPFINAKKKIITYHDLGTDLESRNGIYKFARIMLHIVPSKFFANQITFVSTQTKNEYLKLMHYKKLSKIHVIYNSYDERLIPELIKKESNIFTILHIGTAKRKNLIGLIEACKNLQNIKLDIVGKLDSEQLRKLKDYHIDYTNSYDISFEDVVNHYNSCDIVSFPTFYEGFGLPVIEANAMCKPIISSDIPIIHEIGGDGVFYINPNNVSELQAAILTLKNNPEIREKLVNNGKENIKRFTNKEICRQYSDLYKIE